MPHTMRHWVSAVLPRLCPAPREKFLAPVLGIATEQLPKHRGRLHAEVLEGTWVVAEMQPCKRRGGSVSAVP